MSRGAVAGVLTSLATTRATCRRIGLPLSGPIHSNDLWVAVTALHLQLPLVTADQFFDDVPGLSVLAPSSLTSADPLRDWKDLMQHPGWVTEGVRLVFVLKGQASKEALDRWINCAHRCHIPSFVKLQQRIVKHRTAIDAALDPGLSNALIESTNTKIRLITRIVFGFDGPKPLIAFAMLSLGSHPRILPGRT